MKGLGTHEGREREDINERYLADCGGISLGSEADDKGRDFHAFSRAFLFLS